jgi:diketogulonate reductase-like aldo/keto reductase
MVIKDFYTLNHGVKIPKIGFGTWQIKEGDEAYQSTLFALKSGYRHIDTAAAYGNEKSVGLAIKDSGIAREDLYVTTKLQSHIKGYYSTLVECERSLEKLGLKYLDLYLIHAPWPWAFIGVDNTQGNIESWKAMIELHKQGKIKSIGVSNFEIKDLQPIVEATGFIPHVNQIPFWIGRPQTELRAYCDQHKILIEAYSPLATGRIFKLEILHSLAKKYNVTPAQLAIRYTLDMGTLPLPKSTNQARIIENIQLDFSISKVDLMMLSQIKTE